MYILNPNETDVLSFHPLVQKYLINSCKLPIYSKKGKTHYFRKTKRLQEELNKAPLWVRIIVKGG